MQADKNILLTGSATRPILLDIIFEPRKDPRPVVIYAHGFNGFKDWGNFDLIAERFVAAGYVLVKFNFSHNGTTPAAPKDFGDLEAFGQNNYTKELEDVRIVMDWVCNPANIYRDVIDSSSVSFTGHSMGGGIAVLHAAEDSRVKKLVTWAGISECTTPWGGWPEEKMEQWKKEGVQYYTNSRTKQQMPLYYQLYEDYCNNKERLDIRKAIQCLTIPILICHGTQDTAVPVEKAHQLQSWQPAAIVFTVESDHVFGRKHLWTEQGLPVAMEAVLAKTLEFLNTKQTTG